MNDKVDAAILAQLLRADLLPEAWIAPPEVRQVRALLRHRVQLVRLPSSASRSERLMSTLSAAARSR